MTQQVFTIDNIMELIKQGSDKNPWRRLIAYINLRDVMQYHSIGVLDIEIDDFLAW